MMLLPVWLSGPMFLPGGGSPSLVPCSFQEVSVWVSLTETPPGQRTPDIDPWTETPKQRPP